MAYVAPIHQPGSVRHALKLNFLSSTEECLVVAKSNRLEFYIQTPDGLSLAHSRTVYGRVTMLQKLRPDSSSTDHLFVGTDRYMHFVLSWDPYTKQLQTEKSFVDQADKFARDSQTGDRCSIDPNHRFLTLELYEGVVTIVPIIQKQRKNTDPAVGTLGDPIMVRVEEMFVRASAFFDLRFRKKNDRPRMAFIFEDSQRRVRLKVRQLSYTEGLNDAGSAELLTAEKGQEEEPRQDAIELGASHIIPIPYPTAGYLVLGESSIMYHETSSNVTIKRSLKEATIFVAWEQIDRQRYILADEYGKLYLLMLELGHEDEVEGWRLDVLGQTSRASVLVYLGEGKVFVGSHQGDSQVVLMRPHDLIVLQTFPNIGPILDFTIMDMGSRGGSGEGQMNEYSSGQARLVTGSGAFNDGSLRSVRSGVGLEDLGSLGQMVNITDIFSLKSKSSSQLADTLVVSFVDETRIFTFSATGEVEEVDMFHGLALNEGTLLAANVIGQRLLQVTSSAVRLADSDSGMTVSHWSPPEGSSITAVTAIDDVAVVSIGGTSLVALELGNELNIRSERTFNSEDQVACLHISQSDPSVCIVGFWQSESLSILNISNLETIHTEQISKDTISVPRSLLLVNILEDQHPTLFIAMADGTVITYTFDPSSHALSSRRSMVLGTQQPNFTPLPKGDGLCNVFATCEHPSLIYGSDGRLVYSAITAEDASRVCSLDSEAYPGAIAIATTTELKLAVVDEERSTHVQGLPVGETVRRIAYSSELKAFGLGTIKRELEEGAEVVQSHFKLADEVMFNILATYALNEEELVESVMRCKLNDGYGNLEERFVVGTAYLDNDGADSVRGRILVFEVTPERTLNLLHDHAVKGACRCLAMVEGNIVAALIKTVVVYSFEYETASKPFLRKLASFRTSTAPIDLAVSGNIIAIADLMKSMSIVQFTPADKSNTVLHPAPDKLVEIARHFQTTWATAVAQIDEHVFLESDAEGNLMVLEQDVKSEFADDRRRLRVTSEMLLGEMVNKIRSISVPAQIHATVTPRAFLATVEGSIYMFGLIAPSKQNLLMELQRNLAREIEAPGKVPFMKYRAFRNAVREEDEPMRFVDGEMLEKFLDLSPARQEVVAQGLDTDVEGIRSIVEGLRRLR